MKAQHAAEILNHGHILSALPLLSTPRPNGSRALAQAVASVQSWLEGQGIPVQAHRFTLRPYLMEVLGLWLALSGAMLPVAALARWGWVGLVLALQAARVSQVEALRGTSEARGGGGRTRTAPRRRGHRVRR